MYECMYICTYIISYRLADKGVSQSCHAPIYCQLFIFIYNHRYYNLYLSNFSGIPCTWGDIFLMRGQTIWMDFWRFQIRWWVTFVRRRLNPISRLRRKRIWWGIMTIIFWRRRRWSRRYGGSSRISIGWCRLWDILAVKAYNIWIRNSLQQKIYIKHAKEPLC